LATGLSILMYHSISEGPGPTCISPDTFGEQLEIIASCGYQVISLTEFVELYRDRRSFPARCLVITFDDGFADFAEYAFPALKARGWPATVFLPAGLVGGSEDWVGKLAPPRRLMDWPQVRQLANDGIEFGGHSMTHRDMTRLAPEALEDEIRQSRDVIAQHLGVCPISFAPPYGRSNSAVRQEVSKWYEISLGVRLARATLQCDRFDVPRIEMHYFRHPSRWAGFLQGRAEAYFGVRRLLRNLRRWV
jgi:peptidoglycan/xylan/chitin deacetylase (PgdA/CDA1 family)